MLTAGVFTGLACGALLVAMGLSLWSGSRQATDLSRAVRATGWLAGALLLVGALLAWQADPGLSGVAWRLLLMAALAVPVGGRRHPPSPWGSVMRTLPALILAGTALFWSPGPVGGEGGGFPSALVELAVVICGGFGARALGDALSEIIASTPPIEWPSVVTYVLLTLLVGCVALVNLWQRGSMWGAASGEGGLAAAWLAGGATWLGIRFRPRLRVGLIIVAALLLIAVALA